MSAFYIIQPAFGGFVVGPADSPWRTMARHSENASPPKGSLSRRGAAGRTPKRSEATFGGRRYAGMPPGGRTHCELRDLMCACQRPLQPVQVRSGVKCCLLRGFPPSALPSGGTSRVPQCKEPAPSPQPLRRSSFWSYPVSVDRSGLVCWATPRCFDSYSIGDRKFKAECRRRGLYQPSMNSKTAVSAFSRVRSLTRSINSHSTVAKNDSHIGLS